MYGRVHALTAATVGSVTGTLAVVLNNVAYAVFGAAVVFAVAGLRQFAPARSRPRGRHAEER